MDDFFIVRFIVDVDEGNSLELIKRLFIVLLWEEERYVDLCRKDERKSRHLVLFSNTLQ